MTNGGGKSGSAIVAVKPTNKAEPSAAEPAEPRAEAKGNAGRQSTHRTQSWASVSQALERIRQVVKQSKGEKLIALLHHISEDMLKVAFRMLVVPLSGSLRSNSLKSTVLPLAWSPRCWPSIIGRRARSVVSG